MAVTTKNSAIDFHKGEVLLRLANTYPPLMLTLIESVQNAIDAGATRAMMCIDLQQRTVVVVDNGTGTSREHFEQALASVGRGIKSEGSLGRFGLGLISPLNKCKTFNFISAEPRYKKARRWTFRAEDVKVQHERVDIPCDDLGYMPKLTRKLQPYAADGFAVEWRTMVEMIGVTKDKVVSLVNLDDLESQIQSKLGAAMRAKEVAIRVVLIDERGKTTTRDIQPMHYTGEPLVPVTITEADTGNVTFQLYLAPMRGGNRKGQVSLVAGGSNYPITMAEFARQARGRKAADLLSEAMNVLSSGYFEGLILCDNIVLSPERTKFEYNDALETLYLVIDQWFDDYGRAHYQLEREQNREARWQKIAVKCGDELQQLFARPEFMRLLDTLLTGVEYGRLGDGHLVPQSGTLDGQDDEPSLRAGQGGAGKERSVTTLTRRPKEGVRTFSPVDRPGDKPIGSLGPNGRRRRLVQGDSRGLWFGFEQSPHSTRLWEFDRVTGALIMNVRHPIWVQLDETNGRTLPKNEKWIAQLLKWLAIEVLYLYQQFNDEHDFEQYRCMIDGKVKLYVETFIIPSR